ncbi:uncharacterized protein PHACADRAFT_185049 [Phanerochaete carnosa HHB-10118-sp]|uniref:Conidiation protein 6 n=1 Tax=Phanerochaete carnosa (strain HHB-10118-sp) TaxID=650164 RepID=K5W543_PHACS|nr:uncharacterized protein PHACADRAFT_185049 [Phanerochaete carnosa HHB-10118-sp]EKM54064.1 hypothetical protein PHACADRAFT_185049 [Phanerochaete carnosa HHB-10118-sp]
MVSTTDNKNPERVAAGLKATMHNPNVSEEAKHHAAERLEQMGSGTGTHRGESGSHSSTQDKNRVLGGYKATLANEHTSPEAKKHAREILEAHGYTIERGEGVSEDEHHTRVLAGYKAALHNPRVSDEAKAHAREYLREHDAL